MSHVITSQPSSASPYKPTEISNTNEVPTTIYTGEMRNRNDCCCVSDENDGCCLGLFCNTFGRCCRLIGECTEACCDAFATCLTDCCDDDSKRRNRRYNYDETGYTDNYIVSDQWPDMEAEDYIDRNDVGDCYSGRDGDNSEIRDDSDGGVCDATGGGFDSGGGVYDSGGGFDSGGGCDSGGGDTGGGGDD